MQNIAGLKGERDYLRDGMDTNYSDCLAKKIAVSSEGRDPIDLLTDVSESVGRHESPRDSQPQEG